MCLSFWWTRELLKQALMNLILNAVEAMPGGGRLTVSLERRGEMARSSLQTRAAHRA